MPGHLALVRVWGVQVEEAPTAPRSEWCLHKDRSCSPIGCNCSEAECSHAVEC